MQCQSFETDIPSRLDSTQPGDDYMTLLRTFWALSIVAGLASCTKRQELDSTLATPDLPIECLFL